MMNRNGAYTSVTLEDSCIYVEECCFTVCRYDCGLGVERFYCSNNRLRDAVEGKDSEHGFSTDGVKRLPEVYEADCKFLVQPVHFFYYAAQG